MKKHPIHTEDITVLNIPLTGAEKKAFSEYLKAHGKSIYRKPVSSKLPKSKKAERLSK
jgi:hypothetical protein